MVQKIICAVGRNILLLRKTGIIHAIFVTEFFFSIMPVTIRYATYIMSTIYVTRKQHFVGEILSLVQKYFLFKKCGFVAECQFCRNDICTYLNKATLSAHLTQFQNDHSQIRDDIWRETYQDTWLSQYVTINRKNWKISCIRCHWSVKIFVEIEEK